MPFEAVTPAVPSATCALESTRSPSLVVVVHVAGGLEQRGDLVRQHCIRCARILAQVSGREITALGARLRPAVKLRAFLAAQFFTEGQRVAEGDRALYLVRHGRALESDEAACPETMPT